LEALVFGAYPIQTDTSCGSEWVEKGFRAHLVEPNQNALLEALICINNQSNLDEMRLINKELASKFLDFELIKRDSLNFYGVS
jgi:glycosyltransferase involved in cell wall biosynthesis